MMIFVISALTFSSTNFLFINLTDHVEKEYKRHDLVLKKLQSARGEWQNDSTKRLDFINKWLQKMNKAKACINNADKAMLKYYQTFTKRIKPLHPEPQLSDFIRRIKK